MPNDTQLSGHVPFGCCLNLLLSPGALFHLSVSRESHSIEKTGDLFEGGVGYFFERTRLVSGIQFTKHFIKFIVAETKQCVGTILNVIFTQQTCGQRSSMSVGSKHRALKNGLSDGIRREFFLCLLWRRIHATDNGSIFIGRDFSGVKLS